MRPLDAVQLQSRLDLGVESSALNHRQSSFLVKSRPLIDEFPCPRPAPISLVILTLLRLRHLTRQRLLGQLLDWVS
jgi:hypothetical protein